MTRLDQVQSPSFSGHESFPFRHAWLKKGYDGLEDPEFFSGPEALVKLGVGKNMVYSIRHWMDAFGLSEPIGEPGRGRTITLGRTALADRLLADDGWDPYLEDDGTLWLLHRRLVTAREKATTWWWAFNRPSTATVRRPGLIAELLAAAQANGWRTSRNTVKRDVDCFIRTYLPASTSRLSQEDAIACPLCALGLLQPTADRDEVLMSYGWQPSLPDAVFRWGLAEYLQSAVHGSGADSGTVSLDRLLYDEGAPGRIFRLREEALIERLTTLDTASDGAWVYDETVGLRQLMVQRAVGAMGWLEEYYAREPVQLRVINGGAA